MKVAGDRPRWRVARAPFSRWGAVTLAVFSIAAASDPGTSSGKFPGFVAGAILIALVAYAFVEYLRPLFGEDDSQLTIALLVLGGLARRSSP